MADVAALRLSPPQTAALKGAGYTSAEQVQAASDNALLGVSGIGPATVQQIRSATVSEPTTAPAVQQADKPVEANEKGEVSGVNYPTGPTKETLTEQAQRAKDAAAFNEAVAAERAAAGARLPDQRLDHAGPGHHFIVRGVAVDANGNPVKPSGDYLAPAE